MKFVTVEIQFRRTFCALSLALALSTADLHTQGTATSVDPVALQAAIAENRDFDIAGLWRTLKIPARLDTVYAKVGSVPADSANVPFERCSNTCLAELSRTNVDDDALMEVILAVYQESGVCRFLVFKPTVNKAGTIEWRFNGHADHDFLGQYEPEYRVSVLGGRRYFVMSSPIRSAAGTRVRYERWFEVDASGTLREILSVPAEGLECADDGRGLCRAFSATAVAGRRSARRDELEVAFTVRYWGDERLIDESRTGDVPLFNRVQKGVFIRPPSGTGPYTLAPLDSDIGSEELDARFRPSLTCQDFLMFNSDSLQRIAAEPPSPAKAWLTPYIRACSASPQQADLLHLLTK